MYFLPLICTSLKSTRFQQKQQKYRDRTSTRNLIQTEEELYNAENAFEKQYVWLPKTAYYAHFKILTISVWWKSCCSCCCREILRIVTTLSGRGIEKKLLSNEKIFFHVDIVSVVFIKKHKIAVYWFSKLISPSSENVSITWCWPKFGHLGHPCTLPLLSNMRIFEVGTRLFHFKKWMRSGKLPFVGDHSPVMQ